MSEKGAIHKASRWCYEGMWGLLTPYFKLPKEPPNLPSMEGEHIEYLHPSEAFLNYRKFHFWIALAAIDFALTAAWIILFVAFPLVGLLITPIALAIIILPDIVAYIAIHLNYDTTWYVLSDRSMRIRRGVWNLHETTITFENIQNINIQQGPLQRWFGFSNLVVQTAGGGGVGAHGAAGAMMHIGVLEGLANAQEIRERILLRCGKHGNAGLGEEPQKTAPAEMARSVRSQGHVFSSPQNIELLREIEGLTRKLGSG
jgi:membrane protein YdbS with pleckstrin-like domain